MGEHKRSGIPWVLTWVLTLVIKSSF